jgi:7-keto-8-aminopelargonate synthetase-like enzyme
MARSESFAPAHLVDAMNREMGAAAEAGALMQTADDADYRGRHVQLNGQQLLNFGCCSYLGLELRRELTEGAVAAIHRYGTQFPFPRAMLQSPLYAELDESLRRMTGGHVVIAASTSLAHISALPVLIQPGDAVVIDHFAHASLHTAVALLRGVPVEQLRHSRLDLLEERVRALAAKHNRVFYVLDGLYSMLGDFAPIDELRMLLQKYPSLHLYVDDAHCTSWTGTHGSGYTLDRLADRDRVTVALSLNKAFSAGGGALVFATQEQAECVKRSGGPMVFSGAIQPPLLGAAVASARLHLAPEFADLQRAFLSRIDLALRAARTYGVTLPNETRTPVFFFRCRWTDKTFALVNALRRRGICVCAAMFPIVPRNQAGIRFTVTMHNQPEDIEYLMRSLVEESRKLGIQSGSGMTPAVNTNTEIEEEAPESAAG